jgi:hypothetical protein
MRESARDVEVRGIDQFPLAFFQPDGLVYSLTAGIVPAAA